MMLNEFLKDREHKYDGVPTTDALYRIYANGWTDAVRDIRKVLESYGLNLEIPLE